MGDGKIRVLVVDDSASFRAALCIALASDPEIEVVGQAGDGEEGMALVDKLQPDVITMDVVMPKMDGLEMSKRVLASPRPIPIILMSTLARSDEQRLALNALRLGVVDVTNKPVLAGPDAKSGIASVIRLVKAAAEIDVPHRPRSGVRHFDLAAAKQPRVDLIAIAASTGGPPALERVLGGLPKKFPPVVIAQHLAPSFSKGFADWLAGALGREVASASLRMRLEESTIYVAGEGQHVMVQDGYVMPRNRRANDLTPNADVLFESVAASAGRGAVGIVLTGMGNDGAEGLKAMKDAGAWTIAQDAESSVVYGMPRVAWESGACCEQLPLDVIGARLVALLKGNE